jgi:dTDP-glucose 4,6-dehydratase
MKILLTGGAGFIGANLAHHLVEQGHDVLNIDRLTYAGNRESLADLANHPRHRLLEADIGDPAALRAAFAQHQPDAVMHLAAESHVDRSIDGPGVFVQTNIGGTFNLLQAARGYWDPLPADRRRRFRFLHVSTDEVFGSLGPQGQFSETTPYDPHSPYSASKAASDHLVRAWFHTYGLPTLITNCSNNYGPFQFPEKLIPTVILKAIRHQPIPVYGQGENVRDWLYVGDHAEALARVLDRGRPGQTYNIGGNNEIRNIDIVRRLCQILDEALPRPDRTSYAQQIEFVADRPGHDFRYAIDATKIKTELGWQPRQDPESGFRLTVRWYLDHRPWWERILSGAYRLERIGLGPAQPATSNPPTP